MSYSSNKSYPENLIPPHGGYRDLKAFQMATVLYDFTTEFVNLYIPIKSRTTDQMIQAARSGRQNIAEASKASGTSKKTELKLTNVARSSLEELLLDYEDFLRQRYLKLWTKDNFRITSIRKLVYSSDWSYSSYKPYLKNPEQAANCAICVIHQTNYLLDQLLKRLEEGFLNHGGFTERLYRMRKSIRRK